MHAFRILFSHCQVTLLTREIWYFTVLIIRTYTAFATAFAILINPFLLLEFIESVHFLICGTLLSFMQVSSMMANFIQSGKFSFMILFKLRSSPSKAVIMCPSAPTPVALQWNGAWYFVLEKLKKGNQGSVEGKCGITVNLGSVKVLGNKGRSHLTFSQHQKWYWNQGS